MFSFRDDMGQWDPKNQRPELWSLYNGRVRKGEHVRVFPLSNWTELDVWRYIAAEELEVPPIYFAHERSVIERDGMLLADSEFVPRLPDEEPFEATVRYRTVGDMAVTGAVRSEAATLEAVVAEIATTRVTERGETRADDRVSRPRWRTASARATSRWTTNPLDAPPELLRVVTAGSVDDGKSTLIGRLLHDTKSILDDQLDAVEVTSRERGDGRFDLALLTDGLRAEREQGITIDVAYRFFATPTRSFILADTPGHVRYTRNMVTGASTADVAIVLIDARQGVVEQSKRHAFIAALLHVPHVVACVNKMDLVDWDRATSTTRSSRTSAPSPAASGCPSWRASRSRRSTATTSSTARTRRRGTTARRCSSTSRRSTSPPTARCSTPRGCRCSGSCARTTTPTTTTAATPARWRRARCGSATTSSSCREGARTRIARARHLRRPGRGGVRADVGDRAAGGRPRRRARATCCAPPTRRRRWRATCAPTSAGSTRPPRGPAPATSSSTRPARRARS